MRRAYAPSSVGWSILPQAGVVGLFSRKLRLAGGLLQFWNVAGIACWAGGL